MILFVLNFTVDNERYVIAVLKLLSRTAKIFPGVFYHGQASAVVPVIGRILPLFAEPAFRLVYLDILVGFCNNLIVVWVK